MKKELSNFIMRQYCPETGQLLNEIVMSDTETFLYKDSGYGENFDNADTVKEMACLRVGIDYVDYNDWDMITEQEVA